MNVRYVTSEEGCEILRDERFANWQVPSWPDDAIGQLVGEVIIVIGMSREEAYAAMVPIMWQRTIESLRVLTGA